MHKLLRGAIIFMLVAVSLTTLLTFLISPRASKKTASLNTDSFTLTPSTKTPASGSTFTVLVSVASTDAVSAAQADISYNTSTLQFVSVSAAGSPFNLCPSVKGGSGLVEIACAQGNNTSTGSNPLATITFTMLAKSGSASISLTSGTSILMPGGVETWNGNATTTTLTVPASVNPTPTPTPTPTSGGTTKTTTSGGGSSTSTKFVPSTTSPTPNSVAPIISKTTSPNSPAVSQPISGPVAPVYITVLNSSGTPVVNALVKINGQSANTNTNGVATFNNISPNTYQVSILLPGSSTPQLSTLRVLSNTPSQNLTVKLASTNSFLNTLSNPVVILIIIILMIAFAVALLLHHLFETGKLGNPLSALSHKMMASSTAGSMIVPSGGMNSSHDNSAMEKIISAQSVMPNPTPGEVIMPNVASAESTPADNKNVHSNQLHQRIIPTAATPGTSSAIKLPENQPDKTVVSLHEPILPGHIIMPNGEIIKPSSSAGIDKA